MAASPTGAFFPPRNFRGDLISPWWVAVTVALTTFMEVLDISIANVALRHIAGDLSVSEDEAVWVLTSYMVANAIVLPMSGWLSMLFGRRRFYLFCVAMFSVSSLLCGLAPNLTVLILCRTLQGIGGGGLQPSSQAILTDSFPLSKRGMAFAVYGITTVLAPAIGPTIGGWITDTFSWRWIFLINVPVGFLSLYLSRRLLSDPPALVEQSAQFRRQGLKVDWKGFILLSVGFGCLQVVLDRGQQDDWFSSPFIMLMSALSTLALLILPFWETRQQYPMVDFNLLKERNFLFSNILMFLVGFVLFGSTVLLPMWVQTLMGYSATQAGMLLSPGALTVLLVLPFVGWAINKVDVRHMIAFGLLCNGVALYLFSHMNLQADYWSLATLRILQGIGLGFLFVPVNAAAYSWVPPDKSSNASAIINLSRNLGGSFGISLVQTWLTRGTQRHQSVLTARLTDSSTATQTWLSSMIHQLAGVSSHAAAVAHALLYATVQRQASLLSFMDDFRLLGTLALVFIPVVYALKRPVREKH
ncbi:DHA2 family efflux MFS transporter permease subunit [Ferrovum sp.]|uniref:DHA2 family efflux MFS transporter permease subunit n=1 Tax=Ferrovum sp. TaxID=2609467 RepID=UPI00260DF4BA|nr:DHA2 family efflux MFS transporter permease subunit [Ferrovum sp.]